MHWAGPPTSRSERPCQCHRVLRILQGPPRPSCSPRSPHTALQPGQLGHPVTSASSQRAVITDVLVFLHYSEFLECTVCPRHEAVPARQKFAEWSKPEIQGKAVILGKDRLGRAPQEAAEAEVEGSGQSVALHVLQRKEEKESKCSE